MNIRNQLYINGQWQNADSGETIVFPAVILLFCRYFASSNKDAFGDV